MNTHPRGIALPLLIIGIAIVLGVSIGAIVLVQKRGQEPTTPASTNMTVNTNTTANVAAAINANSATNTNTASAKLLGTYRIENIIQSGEVVDTRLVQIVDGKSLTIIASTRVAASLDENHLLTEFAFPQTGTKLYLNESLRLGSGSPGNGVWSYDVQRKKLEKLDKVKDYFGLGMVVSSNKMRVIVPVPPSPYPTDPKLFGDVKSLYLLDLASDIASSLVTLTGSETLDGGCGGEGSIYTLSWIDDQTVLYSVYDQSTIDCSKEVPKKKIADRKVTVSFTSPTADWKTYTNERYAFSFQYPQDWSAQAENWAPTSSQDYDARYEPRFIVAKSANEQERVFIAPRGEGDRGTPPYRRVVQSTIGGKTVERIIYSDVENESGTFCFYKFPSEPATNWHALYNRIETSCLESETVQTILSTFQFTE